MQYRREIDGLRAVAVVPVILFHAGFESFSGGYLGVDIFFVISGYLITGIVAAELDQDRFSLTSFYERRARRILPALAVVVLACIPFAEWLMLPDQREDFWESVAAVALFSSNVLFWMQTEYFGGAAELKPLLHTWSLAVEEQFYLVFPPFLALAWALGRRWVFGLVIAIALGSLAASHWAAYRYPDANFYLPVTRFWELMAGAACALIQRRRGQWANDALAGLGLALTFGAILIYTEATPFPSLWGLVPIGGVMLIILFAAHGTLTARLLSLSPLVWIGLVSYSAYLWHQPLFAFARLYAFRELTPLQFMPLAAASFALAWVSYRYVEQPFRQRGAGAPVSRKTIFIASGVMLSVFVAAGLILRAPDGNDARYAQLLAQTSHVYGLSGKCGRDDLNVAACRTSDQPEVVLWGDSHAAHLVPALLAEDPDLRLQQATLFRCRPLLGLGNPVTSNARSEAEACRDHNLAVADFIAQTPTVRYVILASPFWDDEPMSLIDEAGQAVPATLPLLEANLRDLASFVRGAGAEPVIVISPPRSDFDIGQCLLKTRLRGGNDDGCAFPADDRIAGLLATEDMLRSLSDVATVVDPGPLLCQEGTCRATWDGVPLYSDRVHYSTGGAAAFGPALGILTQARGAAPDAD